MKRSLCAVLLGAAFFIGAAFSASQSRAHEIVISNFGAQKISIYNTETQAMRDFATDVHDPYDVAFLKSGELLVAEAGEGRILKFSADGKTRSTFASGFGYPVGIAVSTTGDIYVSDNGPADDRGAIGKGSVWKVSPTGEKTPFSQALTGPSGMAFDSAGNLLSSNFSGGTPVGVYKFSPSGVASSFTGSGSTWMPYSLVTAGEDTYIGNYGRAQILRQTGSGAPVVWASGTLLNGVMGMALKDGEMWGVSMRRGSIFRVTQRLGDTTGTVTEVFRGLSAPTGMAFRL